MASGISSVAGSPATATSATDVRAIAGNFTQFLTLLTTQLKNQNPLDPMDTNQFTQQLVQFAGVEQQLKTNDRLTALLTSSKAATVASTSDLVGRSVTADGQVADLKDGAATWTLTPVRAAKQAVVTITDMQGNVVASRTTTLATGTQNFTWDGRGTSGLTQADGTYRIKVDATDATGARVAVDTQVSGTVEGVDLTGSEPVLSVGTARVPLSSVRSVGAGLST